MPDSVQGAGNNVGQKQAVANTIPENCVNRTIKCLLRFSTWIIGVISWVSITAGVIHIWWLPGSPSDSVRTRLILWITFLLAFGVLSWFGLILYSRKAAVPRQSIGETVAAQGGAAGDDSKTQAVKFLTSCIDEDKSGEKLHRRYAFWLAFTFVFVFLGIAVWFVAFIHASGLTATSGITAAPGVTAKLKETITATETTQLGKITKSNESTKSSETITPLLTTEMKFSMTVVVIGFSVLAFFFLYKHRKLQTHLANVHLLRKQQLENVKFAVLYSNSMNKLLPQEDVNERTKLSTTSNPLADFRQALNLISNTRNPITEDEIARIASKRSVK